jgi:argininosuccinate synthase
MKVALAFSGGLDTTYCATWLREQGHEVHTITVNTGGFSDAELARIETVARDAKVGSHTTLDGREYLADRFLRYLVFGNVLRGQAYPLSVSAERVAQAVMVVRRAQELGCEAIAHGSTGAGNDQVRFDVAFRALAPGMKILTPIRDQALSREAETAYLAERGIEIPPKTTRYSINEGMWGTSIGGVETLTSHLPLPEEAFPGAAPDASAPPTTVTVRFERGVAVALAGKPLLRLGGEGVGDEVGSSSTEGDISPPAPSPQSGEGASGAFSPELIENLNALGQRYGIGRGYHLGDTILGIKGRIGFEAPGAYLLIGAHRELEKLVLTGKQLFWKEQMGNLYGALLHEGHFFDPIARDVEAFLESSQRCVTGEVTIALHPGRFLVTGTTSPHSLMNPDVAAYGEGSRMWTGDEAAGFSKLYGVPSYLVARTQGIEL